MEKWIDDSLENAIYDMKRHVVCMDQQDCKFEEFMAYMKQNSELKLKEDQQDDTPNEN